jgi:hypothetical protein
MVLLAHSRLADAEFAEHARQVGIVTAQGAVLEAEVEMLFNIVLGSRYNVSKIIYYALTAINQRLNIIQSLIADNFDGDAEIADEWGKLRNAIDNAIGNRNRVVHAIWAKSPTTGALQRRSVVSRGAYRREKVDVSISDLEAIASELAEVAGRVNQFASRVRARPLAPSPNV